MRVLQASDVIAQARQIHGDRYTYDEFIYKNKRTKVVITCSVHGNFTQLPAEHVKQASGCPKCADIIRSTNFSVLNKARSKTQAEFAKECARVHGNCYNYDKTQYIHSRQPVTITCAVHGDFTQLPTHHIQGSGCLKCTSRRFSKVAIEWLEYRAAQDGVHIQHAMNEGEHFVRAPNGMGLHFDGYAAETNTAYEFLGGKCHLPSSNVISHLEDASEI